MYLAKGTNKMAIELPRDANGQIIPLDTTMMYRDDNSQFHVTDFFYEAKPDRWFALNGNICIETSRLYLDASEKDSLEKLAADIDRTLNHPQGLVCAYANRKKRECNGCKLSGHLSCLKAFTSDISSRVHRLAGDAE